MIEVTDVALRQAAGEGMDTFIGVFTDAYKKEIGGEMTAGTMPLLTGEQHSLLAYCVKPRIENQIDVTTPSEGEKALTGRST